MFISKASHKIYAKNVISVFQVLQGNAETLIMWVRNYTIFQLPAFCETLLPKLVKSNDAYSSHS